jgi:hypothetical protein
MDSLKTLHHWLVSVAMHCPIPSSQQEMHCCVQPQAQHITPTLISHILPLIKVFLVHMHSTMKVYGWHGNEAPHFKHTSLVLPALRTANVVLRFLLLISLTVGNHVSYFCFLNLVCRLSYHAFISSKI